MRTTNRNKSTTMIVAALAVLSSASSVRAIPPDPDNAALVYYQAFLLGESLDKETRDALFDFGRGNGELTDDIRQYVEGSCRTAIEYAVAAAQMRQCNWGFRYSLGFNASMPHLGPLRFLSHAVLAEARILAADGAYRQAYSRCLTVRKMAQHVGDDTLISMLVGNALDGAANRCIRDLLASAPAEVETLQWLKTELGIMSGRPPSAKRAMGYERQVAMQTMQPENRDMLVEIFEGTEVEIGPEQVAMMDDEFLAKNREYYSKFITSMEAILGAPGTYEQRYLKLSQLVEQMQGLAASDEGAVLAAALAPGFDKVYGVQVAGEAAANATQAAVDVCIVKAETGQWPAELPAGLPKDPFSGEDFDYERTDNGFVLRCRGKDLAKDKLHEFGVPAN